MTGVLDELQTIKEAAEAAVALSEDPILTDRLDAIVTEVEGWIDQLTPRAAGTDVQFAEAPKPQQPLQAAPSQVEAEGTPAPEAANADVGGAEDEPEPDPTPTSEHHASGSHRRRSG